MDPWFSVSFDFRGRVTDEVFVHFGERFLKFFRKFFSSFIKVSDGLGSINRFWVGFAIQIQKGKTRH